MKSEGPVLQSFRLNQPTVVANMMGLIVKILWKIYKTPLILLHVALLKT